MYYKILATTMYEIEASCVDEAMDLICEKYLVDEFINSYEESEEPWYIRKE